MKQELLIESLMDTYLSRKPAFVFEHVTHDYRTYYIEVYTKTNPEDEAYIRRNKNFIKKFFDAGYEHKNLGKFMGFRNADSVRQNTAMLKVAIDKETKEIIAMTAYTSHFGGLKCIGGTVIVTDDESLRMAGKESLMQITREDVGLLSQFVWTECSGYPERMWETAGGVRIPTVYLPLFFDDYTMESVEYKEDDPYHYSRLVSRGTVDEKRIEKCIFGFPNRNVLDKYIKDHNTTLRELCKQCGVKPDDILNEDFHYRDAPKHIWPQMRLLRHYSQEMRNGRMEFTEEEHKVITKAIEDIYGAMIDRWERHPEKADGLYAMVLKTVVFFNCCSVLKVYEFGETLELEQEKFPTAALIPDALI